MTAKLQSTDLELASHIADLLEDIRRSFFLPDVAKRLALALVWADPENDGAFQVVTSPEMTDALLQRTLKAAEQYEPGKA